MFPPHRISHRVRKISRMHRAAIEPVDMKSIVPKPLNNSDAPLKSRRLRLSSFWPPSHRTRDGSHRWLSAAARLGPPEERRSYAKSVSAALQSAVQRTDLTTQPATANFCARSARNAHRHNDANDRNRTRAAIWAVLP